MLLAAAAVELLRSHPLLGDHAVGLGYVDKLLRLLAARLPPAGAPAARSRRYCGPDVLSSRPDTEVPPGLYHGKLQGRPLA